MQPRLIWTNVCARGGELPHAMGWCNSDGLRALHVGFVTCAAALVVGGCAGGNSDTSPTVTAQSVAGGSATLNWTAVTSDTAGNALSGLAGYEIHYGTSESTMSEMIAVNDPQQTSYTITTLAPGTWYFSVNAVTSSGVEGLRSNIATKTIN